MEQEERDRKRESDTKSGESTREQQGGEAGTTRFGMEDGDNTDVPATGGPAPDEEVRKRAS